MVCLSWGLEDEQVPSSAGTVKVSNPFFVALGVFGLQSDAPFKACGPLGSLSERCDREQMLPRWAERFACAVPSNIQGTTLGADLPVKHTYSLGN